MHFRRPSNRGQFLYAHCNLKMTSRYRKHAVPFLLLAGYSLLVIIPFVKLGIPSGHDFEFHFNSWIEVVDHWKQGTIYPHWAALAHYGYGEARFIFYPPFSWVLGGLLGLLLPWKLVSAAYIWLVLALSACSMYLLAQNWLPRRDAIFAAVLYAANPYNLVIVYWRSALAELMAGIYLPVLLLLLLRSSEYGRRIVAPLSLLLAAGWLTNIPSAVMMNYSLAILVIATAVWRKSLSVVAYAAMAAVLGVMAAGIYLLPVFHQQHWVNLSQVLAPGVRPVDNFLFTKTDDADHNRFNLLVSIVAIAEITILAALLAFRRRFQRADIWRLLLVWGIASTVLMLKPTLALWAHLPELRFVQLPWRWLLCLNVVFAFAVIFAIRRWWGRALVFAGMIVVLATVWHFVQAPWWDATADIQEMVDNQHDGIGNEGVDEYVPAAADPYEIEQNAPWVRFEGEGDVRMNVSRWFAEKRALTAQATGPGRLILRLFNYPLWQVRINGRLVQTQTTPHTGQMAIPIGAGTSRVDIKFVPGWDFAAGLICSALALIILWTWSALLCKAPAASTANLNAG
jgi:hypothetical protein